MHIGGIPFTDERLLVDEFVTAKPSFPYGSLPVLTVDGQLLAQSAAILRYCGCLADLYPADALEAARADEVVNVVVEFVAGLEEIGGSAEEDDDNGVQMRVLDFVNQALPKFLGGLDRRLQSFGEGPAAVGAGITIADLAIYVCLLNIAAGAFEPVSMKVVQGYTRVVASFEMVRTHPKVVAWNNQIARKAADVRQRAEAGMPN